MLSKTQSSVKNKHFRINYKDLYILALSSQKSARAYKKFRNDKTPEKAEKCVEILQ